MNSMIRIDCDRIKPGERFGSLVASGPAFRLRFDTAKWFAVFQCDCGEVRLIWIEAVKCGNTTACGCRGAFVVPGEKYGRLTVASRQYHKQTKSSTRRTYCMALCECGKECEVMVHTLKSGNTRSCGCLADESRSRLRSPEIERFMKYVPHAPSDGCWLWNGLLNRKGYGSFRFRGKQQCAHRVAYKLLVGEIPGGLFVCHSCDTPACVNPKHLWLGTAADNNRDRDIKGRQRSVSGDAHWMRAKPELAKKLAQTRRPRRKESAR